MLKLISTGGTITASENIPLTVEMNTNNNLTYNNGVVINKAGIYDIKANFVVTSAVAEKLSIQIYNNGTPIAEAIATETYAEVGDTHTLTIVDAERYVPILGTNSILTFIPSTGATLNSADVVIKKIK